MERILKKLSKFAITTIKRSMKSIQKRRGQRRKKKHGRQEVLGTTIIGGTIPSPDFKFQVGDDIVKKKHGFRVHVGDDIVFEILTWLPYKSVMRFKCISKAWNNLARHDPNFVKLHIARSHARGSSATHLLFDLGILRQGMPSTSTGPPIFFPKTQHLERYSLQLAPHHYLNTRSMIYTCSNQCNGLICIFKLTHVYLYNITTGEMKPLVFSLNCRQGVPTLFLGFDTVTEKYKLLHVFYCEGLPKIEILTLGANSWREIVEETSPGSFSREGCIFLDGILYWTNHSTNNPIVYFDFTEEKFGILSPPNVRNVMPTTLWQKLARYWFAFCQNTYEKGSLISDDEVSINSYDCNLKKVASLFEAKWSEKTEFVLATTSFISAPASLVFPNSLRLRDASSFVENIIPLTLIGV